MNVRVGTAPASKAAVYESFGNPALLRAVRDQIPACGSVLDVGCASGGLLASLGDRAVRRVGIEVDPSAAAAARHNADEVYTGAVDDVDPGSERFDVVVLGDVLEHVAHPAATLARVATWVAVGGRLVVSLPNVAHWSVRLPLTIGRWDYDDTGILDRTHLRFFTWSSGARLVEQSGLEIVGRRPVVPSLATHVPFVVPGRLRAAWQRVGRRWPGLFAYQQLVVARVVVGKR